MKELRRFLATNDGVRDEFHINPPKRNRHSSRHFVPPSAVNHEALSTNWRLTYTGQPPFFVSDK
jgi:hypothetical protein